MGKIYCSQCGVEFDANGENVLRVGNQYKVFCPICIPVFQREEVGGNVGYNKNTEQKSAKKDKVIMDLKHITEEAKSYGLTLANNKMIESMSSILSLDFCRSVDYSIEFARVNVVRTSFNLYVSSIRVNTCEFKSYGYASVNNPVKKQGIAWALINKIVRPIEVKYPQITRISILDNWAGNDYHVRFEVEVHVGGLKEL